MRPSSFAQNAVNMSQYVLNASSLRPDETELAEGRSLTATLLQTIAELDSQLGGPARPLKLPQHAWDLILARGDQGEELSLGDYAYEFYSSAETYDLAVFFDALLQHAPAADMLDDETVEAILRLTPDAPAAGFEMLYEAICAADCDAMQCAVTGGTLLSLDFPFWDFDRAAVMCQGSQVEIDHASRLAHVDAIVGRRHDAVLANLTQQNFNVLRAQAFPALLWGQDIPKQISEFPTEYLQLAFKRLAKLDGIARGWQDTATQLPDFSDIEIKPESDLTMQNYGAARRFRSSAGPIVTYELHANIGRGTRIHLLINEADRTIEIGYIGTHLPTWKFN